MKVVVNRCFGGFSLSDEAIMLYGKLSGRNIVVKTDEDIPSFSYFVDLNDSEWYDRNIDRSDKYLVQVVEELGNAANGRFAALAIVDIPDNIEWHIEEYDGSEHIEENHRTW